MYVRNLESLKELYYQAINEFGSEKMQLCKIVFFGPPGVGKSSLCSVLLKKIPQSNRNSTGIFDLKLVQFTVEVTKDNKECKSDWNVVRLEEEMERLSNAIKEKIDKKRHTVEIQPRYIGIQSKYIDIQPHPAEAWSIASDELLQILLQKQPSVEDATVSNVKKDQNIHEVICQYMSDSPSAARKLETYDKTLIALYDSGGQPEFFDVMPLLNTVPTGNVMIFNLNEPLDAKISPEVFEEGHCMSTGKITDYTNAELLKTAIANIESCITMQSYSPINNNKVLVVGTHLDKYKKSNENVEKALSQIDNELNKKVLNKSTGDMIVYYKREGKEDRIVHPISNTEYNIEQDEVAQKIRTAIEEMSNDENSKAEIPTTWMLFQYQIRLLKKPCIKLSDCYDIAERCYVEEDVKVILEYFHGLGILLNYKGLDDVVFCNPQWLFNQLSQLIRVKYNATYRVFVAKGIINKSFMAKNIFSSLENDTCGVIKLNDLLKLFVSLNIMAGLFVNHSKKDSDEQYFIPALLDPAPPTLSLLNIGKKFSETMYVMYKGMSFPRGMFCCLITLLTKKNFKLLESKQYIYKDLIVFQETSSEENQNYLVLSDKISYMTVELYQDYEVNLLQRIYCKLLEALQNACKAMKLNYQFEFGFANQSECCQGKITKETATTIAVVQLEHNCCPKDMCCKSCGKCVPLSYNQLLWFIPSMVLNLLQSKVSTYIRTYVHTYIHTYRYHFE